MVEKSILVIDDEERIARSLQSLLLEEGYDAQIATGGNEGLEMLKARSYHVVVTDLRMPQVDGFKIMDYLSKESPNTAIIVITGHASMESAIEAIHQRVVDYLTKPFEFDHLLASIEKVFAQLEAENLREDMQRMITHDIKVPLNSIIGFAQFIVDGTVGDACDKTKDFARKISDNAQRITALLDNYLTQSRAESGKLEITKYLFNLNDTIEESYRVIKFEFEKKHITVHTEMDENVGLIVGDENLMYRSISNLISNAAKYTPDGGEVFIRTKAGRSKDNDEGVFFEIENNGPGMTDEEQKKVFMKYQRVSTAMDNPGAGIGLFVVSQVSKAHGGFAECKSSPEGPTKFTIFIPKMEEDQKISQFE